MAVLTNERAECRIYLVPLAQCVEVDGVVGEPDRQI